jgi:hypothetical protein
MGPHTGQMSVTVYQDFGRNFGMADHPSRMHEDSPVLELHFGNQLQEPKKHRALIRG